MDIQSKKVDNFLHFFTFSKMGIWEPGKFTCNYKSGYLVDKKWIFWNFRKNGYFHIILVTLRISEPRTFKLERAEVQKKSKI